MAVSVDTVYQTVLALANKEQRGYITPQEFNLHAEQAQMGIFDQYFYDLNQFKRIPGNNTKHSDMTDLIEEKISHFKQGPTNISNGTTLTALPGSSGNTFYKLTNVFNVSYDKRAEEISCEDVYKTQYSPLTKATKNRPVYYRKTGKIYLLPSAGQFVVNWIRKPKHPKWTYIVVNEKPLHNPTTATQDFELHPSEQTDLVIKILQLSGVTIKDYNLTQVAAQEEIKNIQQEKR